MDTADTSLDMCFVCAKPFKHVTTTHTRSQGGFEGFALLKSTFCLKTVTIKVLIGVKFDENHLKNRTFRKFE